MLVHKNRHELTDAQHGRPQCERYVRGGRSGTGRAHPPGVTLRDPALRGPLFDEAKGTLLRMTAQPRGGLLDASRPAEAGCDPRTSRSGAGAQAARRQSSIRSQRCGGRGSRKQHPKPEVRGSRPRHARGRSSTQSAISNPQSTIRARHARQVLDGRARHHRQPTPCHLEVSGEAIAAAREEAAEVVARRLAARVRRFR